ncbi:MAG: recombination regulator RecX [bacterium]|nr:recombination regulator RecX [bacterium]
MQITKIEKQEKRDRYNLHADGEFLIALDAGVLAEAGLSEGDILTKGELTNLEQRDRFAKALTRAYRLLARRSHGTGELTRKLKERGFPASLIGEVCSHLQKLRYLDDRSFARQWVAFRGVSRGPRLLTAELRQRRVADEIIKEALGEQGSDQTETATVLARRRLERFRGASPDEARRKVGAFLTRRGYDHATVRTVLDKIEVSE